MIKRERESEKKKQKQKKEKRKHKKRKTDELDYDSIQSCDTIILEPSEEEKHNIATQMERHLRNCYCV